MRPHRGWQAITRALAGVAVIACLAVGCTSQPITPGASPNSSAPQATPSASAQTTAPTAGSTTGGRPDLAQLVIDDGPHPDRPYRRSEWPTWTDPDGDGCDAREQALIAQATGPVERGLGCTVISGHWVSPYDGVETTWPGDLDADHLVPLANVHQSGGWQWDAATRTAYANDPDVLVMVTAHANRSKGDKTPVDYRPPLESYWCTYATRWLGLKVKWHLTATRSERDALGQMLDTCPR